MIGLQRFQAKLVESARLLGEERVFAAEYLASKIIHFLRPETSKPMRMLDFGCQDGLIDYIVKFNLPDWDVVGTDISPWGIEFAQNQYETVSFVLCTTTVPLNFEAESFDVIVSCGVFHHIPTFQHNSYVKELMRLLKPHGKLLIVELNPYNSSTRRNFQQDSDEQGLLMLNPWYTKKLLADYGTTKLNFFNFFPQSEQLRFLEPYMTKIPFGQHYGCMVIKR